VQVGLQGIEEHVLQRCQDVDTCSSSPFVWQPFFFLGDGVAGPTGVVNFHGSVLQVNVAKSHLQGLTEAQAGRCQHEPQKSVSTVVGTFDRLDQATAGEVFARECLLAHLCREAGFTSRCFKLLAIYAAGDNAVLL